jgi:hypothetical protein
MQAVVEARRTRPDWTAYLIPLAINADFRGRENNQSSDDCHGQR